VHGPWAIDYGQNTVICPGLKKLKSEQMNEEDLLITQTQLEIVTGLMQLLKQKQGIQFLLNSKKKPEGEYLFGFDEDMPEAPWLQLRIIGGGIGDYYSGSVEYEEIYSLENVKDEKGMRMKFRYEHMATNLAGDCSRFYSNYLDDDALDQFETEFYTLWRAGITVPEHYTWLLPK
jgi:hypothetical protein